MENIQTKVIEITYLTAASGAYACSPDGSQCYISTSMRNSHDLAVGDKYYATVKDNYEAHKHKVEHIAIQLHIEHPSTVLVDEEVEADAPVVMAETTCVPTTDNPSVGVSGEPTTRTLSDMRDQMFTILTSISEGELSDMILDILGVEPMGFVDVLWSVLSINPIRHKDMSDTQRKCYMRIHNACMALHKSGKLVEAKYTTYNAQGKSNTSIVYAVSQRMVDPTFG